MVVTTAFSQSACRFSDVLGINLAACHPVSEYKCSGSRVMTLKNEQCFRDSYKGGLEQRHKSAAAAVDNHILTDGCDIGKVSQPLNSTANVISTQPLYKPYNLISPAPNHN